MDHWNMIDTPPPWAPRKVLLAFLKEWKGSQAEREQPGVKEEIAWVEENLRLNLRREGPGKDAS
jgi:hypothetical protein